MERGRDAYYGQGVVAKGDLKRETRERKVSLGWDTRDARTGITVKEIETDKDRSRFAVIRTRQLIDMKPFYMGKSTLVWDAASKLWVEFPGKFGEMFESIPIDEAAARQFQQDGTLPKGIDDCIKNDTGHYPDPWDD